MVAEPVWSRNTKSANCSPSSTFMTPASAWLAGLPSRPTALMVRL